jgi:hypothetical protein
MDVYLMAKEVPPLFVVCSLTMSVRCVQGLFTAQTLTRRFACVPLHCAFPLCANVSILFDALGAGLSGRCEIILRINMWRGW